MFRTVTNGQVLASIACCLVAASSALAGTTLIHAGDLLAVPGERSLSNQTIVIVDNRIRDVRSGFVAATEFGDDVSIIDLRSYFVLPGLLDMHVHLQGELGPNNERDNLKMSPELKQMRSLHFAMKTLLAGFTTVRVITHRISRFNITCRRVALAQLPVSL